MAKPTSQTPPLALSRRHALRLGSLSLLGFNLPSLLEARARSLGGPASPTFGRAKACILLFMWGGPAQQDTWDLKPDAPDQIRGEFKPIATRIPGVHIGEHFPLLARQTHRLAIIRSVHHADVNHTTATHELLTGNPVPRVDSRFEDDSPHFGAVLAHQAANARPIPFAQFRPISADNAPRFVEQSHGQGGGWLGPALQPLTIDLDPNTPDYRVDGLALEGRLSWDRVRSRDQLSRRLFAPERSWKNETLAPAHSTFQSAAYEALADPKLRAAFDLQREDPRIRDRYGRHPHGQAALQARRLVEAGVPLTTVFWQNDGLTNVSVYWDTHNRNFIDLKNRLMPPADQAFSALLDDLDARGLLDETLVVWTGEFGRTPRVGQSVVGGAGAGRDGRDHWPHCFTTVLAGGGIRGGVVHGASDRSAAYPARDPVTPADIAATIYHALGVDPTIALRDSLGRVRPLCHGAPIHGILL